MESLGYWRHSNIVNVQQWTFTVLHLALSSNIQINFSNTFSMEGLFLHCVYFFSSVNRIEDLVVQILDHKYVWTSVWVRSDSWGPEPLSQQSIIGHIVACVCCHEITFQPFDLLLLARLNTYLCSAQGSKSCLYRVSWHILLVIFLRLLRETCGPQFIAPCRQCQVNPLTTVLKLTESQWVTKIGVEIIHVMLMQRAPIASIWPC